MAAPLFAGGPLAIDSMLCVLLAVSPAVAQRPAPSEATAATVAPARTLAVVEIADKLDDLDRHRRGDLRSSHFGTVIRNTAAEAGLDVVSKEEVQARLAELRAAGMLAGVTGENHVRVARSMRTDLVLIAEITSLDELLTFDLQLVDARTGYVVHGDTVRGIQQSDVEREVVPAVKRMLGYVPHRGVLSRCLIAGGAVAGLAGGFFAIRAKSALQDWHNAGTAAAWSDSRQRLESSTTVANAAFISGAAIGVIGLALFFATDYW